MFAFSKIDCSYYISLPGFSWDSMLRVTECELELPTDYDMVLFIKSGIRGGVSYINTRYAEAAAGKEEIFYIDANNLYGILPKFLFYFILITVFVWQVLHNK